jgi:aminoglycoside 2'-N-acetyltransferase I
MELQLALYPTGKIPEDIQREIDEINQLCFGDDEYGRMYQWSSGDWQLTGSLAGKIIASIEILERMAQVGNTPVRLGGIGGVATHPDWQRRGFASVLMNEAARIMRDTLQVDFGLLICSEERVHLYGSLGWQVAAQSILIEQPEGKIVMETTTMILPCRKQDWPEGFIDLCGPPW